MKCLESQQQGKTDIWEHLKQQHFWGLQRDEVKPGLLNRYRESPFNPNIFPVSQPRSPSTERKEDFQETLCWKSEEVEGSLREETGGQQPRPRSNSFGEKLFALSFLSSLCSSGASCLLPFGLWGLRSLADEKCLHTPWDLVRLCTDRICIVLQFWPKVDVHAQMRDSDDEFDVPDHPLLCRRLAPHWLHPCP